MEITYRSENPCNIKPEIFTTGGYTVKKGDKEITFDFEDMTANIRFENGYLYIDSMQKHLDETTSDGINPEELDKILRSVKKEDFTEVFYECYADQEEKNFIKLLPESIVFYDYSEGSETEPIEVSGKDFINI